MKVLYVSPEHVSGGFGLFAQGHRDLGADCRYVTFFRSDFGFAEDLCFDLRFMPNLAWVAGIRHILNKLHSEQDIVDLCGNPPFWKPLSPFIKHFYNLRDLINKPRIENAIKQWKLEDYDIYHFEQGIDPYRDSRWVKKLAAMGKGIVCFYHGSDVRNRGVLKDVHERSQLNLTSEIDLLSRMDGIKYLYLPIDTDKIVPDPRPADGRIKISHAARNRKFKGSDLIESTVQRLIKNYPIDWVMIENVNHDKALQLKSGSDIFIDQITDAGGWGYGASSVESLAMGIATMTRINDGVAEFLGENPFISVTPDNLESQLSRLIEEPELRMHHAQLGRQWVIERHGLANVMKMLYGYYSEVGLI